MSGLLALVPVRAGREEELAAALAGMPNGARSPLGRVPGTHFARLVLVPHLDDRRRRPRRRAGAFLALAAEFDAPLDGYVAALRDELGAELDPVFDQCAGYPGSASPHFADWLLAHVVSSNYSVIGYPGVSLEEARACLELRQRLGRFAVRARGLDPERLQREWGDEFGRAPR